jgi:bifunctional non-homologous end joining protein LigD
MTWRDDPASVRPMLASTGDAPLNSPDLAYEPKYDGIRAIVSIEPACRAEARRAEAGEVRFWSRLGNEKTKQFPEIAAALREWARPFDRPLVVDGEIVALNGNGDPVGFQNLQGRIHLKAPAGADLEVGPNKVGPGTAFIAFDLLRDGDEDLRGLPLRERRVRLERLFAQSRRDAVRISEQATGDAHALHARAAASGWEGIVAKRLAAPYHSGRRTPDWRKLKLSRRQSCVIGGWTDPRGTRPFFGALLLGVYDEAGRLDYVGHSGAGFSDAELGRVWKKLQSIQSKTCPFASVPRTNERPHWVRPQLVAEVKFTEWTADGKLRHPTYLGLRDDVEPRTVRKEPQGRTPRSQVTVGAGPQAGARAEAAERARAAKRVKTAAADLIIQLDAIQASGGNGVLSLPDGDQLEVSNLGKLFWPKLKLTKGDLFRHYARVSPYILPAIADRPLVMKRYPNGVEAKPFYQHRAPDKVPRGIVIMEVESESEKRPHVIGGSLKALLYTTQLASISQDPWFSRVQSLDIVDHVAIDLDPPDGAPFHRVLDVARWVREELDSLKAPGFAKTSGAAGLHIYIPMPPGTPYEAGLLFCQIVATMVARKHPKQATVERSVNARGGRVYVDYLQNIRGKTLASAYSARASDFAGVSTPLTWDEVEAAASPKAKFSPQEFTIRSFEQRLAEAGDLWAALRKAKGADLRAVLKYANAGS